MECTAPVQLPTAAYPAIRSVLVADDDASMCDAIARTLGRRGFYVETVGTGGDALALLRSVKFGLALLDLQLPDMSGLEVARQLGARRATPCVLISGFLDASVEAEARALGIERVIEKPLAIDDVVATVGAAFPD